MADNLLSSPDRFVAWSGFLVDPDNFPIARPGVYLIVHVDTGKCYVGISHSVKRRLHKHAGGGSPRKLTNAIKKYGRAAFVVQPIYYSLSNAAHLPEAEATLIEGFVSIDWGYNIKAGDGKAGPYGPAYSALMREVQARPEVRERMAEAREQSKEAIAAALRAYVALPGVRQRMAEVGRECQMRPDVRERKAAAARTAHQRPETKAKYDAVYNDPEWQARRIAAIRASMARPEMFEKLSARSRAVFANPKVRAKLSEAAKNRETPALVPGTRMITDGTKDAFLPPGVPLPSGWGYGSAARRGRRMITDGKENTWLPIGLKIPDGWRYGKVKGKEKKSVPDLFD